MNVIAGSSPALSRRPITSGRRGTPNLAGRRLPRAGRPAPCPTYLPVLPIPPSAAPPLVTALRDPHQLRVDLRGRGLRPGAAGVLGPVNRSYRRGHQHVLPERHRARLVHDHSGAAADVRQPLAELLGVAHRRRQRDDLHRLGQVDDHLFPHRAAELVRQVVHLVEHDVAEPGQRGRARVQHVPQHLGRHHDHRRLAVHAVVAGQQADLGRPVAPDQIGVLLVGQRLDRGGVEALAPLGQRQVHRELPDHRLARAGRRRHSSTPCPALSALHASS